MSPGNLLKRNERTEIDVVIITSEEEEGTNDPLSPNFIIPSWLIESPTPWNLVSYFDQCLGELVLDGTSRSVIGDYKRELRPAKQLLSNGLDIAVRACRLTANETFGPVTMYRVLERVPQIQQTRRATN
jgi:hypothetical protein